MSIPPHTEQKLHIPLPGRAENDHKPFRRGKGRHHRGAATIPFRAWERSALLLTVAVPVASVAGILTGAGRETATAGFAALAVLYALMVASVAIARRDHVMRFQVGLLDTCVRAFSTCALALLLLLAADAALEVPHPLGPDVALFGLVSISLCTYRVTARLIERRARSAGGLNVPTLVIGAGVIGARIAHRLTQHPELGFAPAGFLDSDPKPHGVELPPGVPVLGGPDDLSEAVRTTGARQVILAFTSERDHRLVELVKSCHALDLEVSIVPRLYESINRRVSLGHLGGLPLLALRPLDPAGWQFTVKYALDRAIAFVVLLFLAPVLAAVGAAVRLSSPGPVIFRQRRVGRDGKEFDLFKFRTMTHAPEAHSEGYQPVEGIAPGGVEGADRRTPIGRWLRDTSLDELPQLFNVLRGEMSLVGPRPERPEFVSRFSQEISRYDDRHRVRSGITGWAQVNGLRGKTSIADRVEWDNHYIHNWSVGLELRIWALTLAEILRFREDKQSPSNPWARARSASAPGAVTVGGAALTAATVDRAAADAVAVDAAAAGAPSAGETTYTAAPADATAPATPVLKVVDGAGEDPGWTQEEEAETRWFCGYCGITHPAGGTPAPVARVCPACGVGLMLETLKEVAPTNDEPFLVIDGRMTVQALSRSAEQLLGTTEPESTDRHVLELLVAADAEGGNDEGFLDAIAHASTSGGEAYTAVVRPRDTFGVRIHTRIAYCGPPRAALVVLETGAREPTPPKPHLRLVEPKVAKAG